VLGNEGYLFETPERFDRYSKDLDEYGKMAAAIGKQYLAHGEAELRNDDNDDRRSRGRGCFSYVSSGNYLMEREGEPTKCVIDVLKEQEISTGWASNTIADDKFWSADELVKKNLATTGRLEESELEELRTDEMLQEAASTKAHIYLPYHLYLVIFDLRRHMRFEIHMYNLEEYKYDTGIADKLVLPDEQMNLVRMLADTKSAQFNDIVKGKSGGSIVLLCGQPGTGKTLTAEVLAEADEKPLYSVQASQLGTNESELEQNLMKCLGRAKRWGAIMLLDESDVYIRKRGADIRQNAIVGVFLRVLEYYTSVLFLTTNRPNDVDDAVASRCIAKLVYLPFKDPAKRKKAWQVLSEVAKIKMDEAAIDTLVEEMPNITGRDIKNLLKLAHLFSKSHDEPITAQTIKFVHQFKPTETE
jgi:hypothetical protein